MTFGFFCYIPPKTLYTFCEWYKNYLKSSLEFLIVVNDSIFRLFPKRIESKLIYDMANLK